MLSPAELAFAAPRGPRSGGRPCSRPSGSPCLWCWALSGPVPWAEPAAGLGKGPALGRLPSKLAFSARPSRPFQRPTACPPALPSLPHSLAPSISPPQGSAHFNSCQGAPKPQSLGPLLPAGGQFGADLRRASGLGLVWLSRLGDTWGASLSADVAAWGHIQQDQVLSACLGQPGQYWGSPLPSLPGSPTRVCLVDGSWSAFLRPQAIRWYCRLCSDSRSTRGPHCWHCHSGTFLHHSSDIGVDGTACPAPWAGQERLSPLSTGGHPRPPFCPWGGAGTHLEGGRS